MTPTPPNSPKRLAYLAPVVLALTLLAGIGLHYQPDVRPIAARLVRGNRTAGTAVTKPVDRLAEVKPEKRGYPARNRRVARSESCVDCESFYLVHDGKGGTIRRSEGYTTRCCACGSTVAFSDGYYYDISCAGNQLTVKMGKRVSDAE